MSTPSAVEIRNHYAAENARWNHCNRDGANHPELFFEEVLAHNRLNNDPRDATIASLTEQRNALKGEVERLVHEVFPRLTAGYHLNAPERAEARANRETSVALLRRLGLALAVLFLGAITAPAHAAEDAYYPMPLAELVAKRPADRVHSHLCVTGTVSSVRQEADGDFHVRLCDGGLCLVLEVIPELPLPRPKKGSRIEACGVSRWDSWHGWWELHPAVRWRDLDRGTVPGGPR